MSDKATKPTEDNTPAKVEYFSPEHGSFLAANQAEADKIVQKLSAKAQKEGDE